VIDLVLNCACFVYIGAWLPFEAFNSPELGVTVWRLVILLLCILTVRRIPVLLLLFKWVPEITSWREALFSGHFGPMGVGAVFVSTLALSRLPQPHIPPQNQQELLAATLQTIVSFIVLGSIIIHGLSIPFFSFGRRIHTRTLSLTRTWTSRQPIQQPDWLLWARRTSEPATVESPVGVDEVATIGSPDKKSYPDPESGVIETMADDHDSVTADQAVEIYRASELGSGAEQPEAGSSAHPSGCATPTLGESDAIKSVRFDSSQ